MDVIKLFEEMKVGNKEASNELGKILWPQAYFLAKKWANKYHRYDKDEITRVAGLAITLTLKDCKEGVAVKSYLSKVIVSVSADHWRKNELVPVGARQYLKGRPKERKRLQYLSLDFDPGNGDDPAEYIETQETKNHRIKAIHLALQSIAEENERAARALTARYLEEQTVKNIATELGIHYGHVSRILIEWFPKFAQKVKQFVGEDNPCDNSYLRIRNTK